MNISNYQSYLTLNTVLEILQLPTVEEDKFISGITIDSRIIERDSLFIAIEGHQFDGHDYVQEALKKGAIAAIVSQDDWTIEDQSKLIKVKSTLEALQKIAHYKRRKFNAPVIAITGSAGKTTTKEMLAHVLRKFGNTTASKASFNNHWGVPLTLLDIAPETEFTVIEIGMNKPGEIEPLSKLTSPNIALITAIGEAHIGCFDNLSNIAKEKASIFKGLTQFNNIKMNKSGYAIYSTDISCKEDIDDIAKDYNIVNVSSDINNNSFVQLIEIAESIEENKSETHVTIKVNNQTLTYILPIIGLHFVQNSLLVIAVCQLLSLDMNIVCEALKTFHAPCGRGNKYNLILPDGKQIILIDDAYNSNPLSLKVGLQSLSAYYEYFTKIETDPQKWISSQISQNVNIEDTKSHEEKFSKIKNKSPKKIIVLGEMLELGKHSQYFHELILNLIKKYKIDLVYCCGKEMSHLFKILPLNIRGIHSNDPNNLIPPLISHLNEGDIVYIKGSKNSRVSIIVDYLFHLCNFPDELK